MPDQLFQHSEQLLEQVNLYVILNKEFVMNKLKAIALLLLLVLVACDLTELASVNITFTTTSATESTTATPTPEVTPTTRPIEASTVTPVATASTATPPGIATAEVEATTSANEVENIRTIATRRIAELRQYAQNVHTLLREIKNGQIEQPGLLNRVNDLNNDLAGLWLKIAGYGLGTDPYRDNIQLSSSGFSRPEPPGDYGISGPYTFWGLPRLYERFAELSGHSGQASPSKDEFAKLVYAYSNPALYPHRDFYERAYADYRLGQKLSSPQYTTDLETLDQWLSELENALDQVPAYFAIPNK